MFLNCNTARPDEISINECKAIILNKANPIETPHAPARPKIPLAIPNLAGNEGRYLQECVTSTFVSTVGPFVGRFEDMVAKATGAQAAVATSAGTTALHAALVAAGVGRGDLVIVQALTFIATVSGIHWSGASPWFVEASPESWSIDCEKLDALLQREVDLGPDGARHRTTRQRVAAIMPVYTLGNMPDMDRLTGIAKRYGMVVIADAAAALGATYKSRALADFGADLSIISFNGNKTVTAGGGGAVVSNNRVLLDKVRHLTTTARVGAGYLHDVIGFNYRMTNLQAAVGVAQMELLERFVERKRQIRRRYNEALGDIPGVRLFPEPAWGQSACWFSGIVLDDRYTRGKPGIMSALRDKSIDVRDFWMPMHKQPPLASALADNLAFTEDLWSRIVTLPCSTNLTDLDQDYVIENVQAVLRDVSVLQNS